MADMKQLTGLFKLPLELRERIYEGLFSEGEVLHIPEPDRKTIAAVVCSSKSVCDELTNWRAARKQLISTKKKYTNCVFTVSPSSRPTAPASPKDWPYIKDIEIVIDDLSLEKSHRKKWAQDPELDRQVTKMRSDFKSFVAWVCERNAPLTSVGVRFTQDDEGPRFLTTHVPIIKHIAGVPNGVQDWATVLAHLLGPVQKLPSCANSIVEQTSHAQERLSRVDEGLDWVDDLGYDYEIGYKLALQGWLKLGAGDRENHEFEDILEDLAYVELNALWRLEFAEV